MVGSPYMYSCGCGGKNIVRKITLRGCLNDHKPNLRPLGARRLEYTQSLGEFLVALIQRGSLLESPTDSAERGPVIWQARGRRS